MDGVADDVLPDKALELGEAMNMKGGGGKGRGGGGDSVLACRGPQSLQSVANMHAAYSEPGPPSSQMPSLVYAQAMGLSLVQTVELVVRRGGGGGGTLERGPQSEQSSPNEHAANSEPGPPSSQSPSDVNEHKASLEHSCRDPGGSGGGGCGDGDTVRQPQSSQSVPMEQDEYSEPAPPSSQSPSDTKGHDRSLAQSAPGGSGAGEGTGEGAGGAAR